MTTDLSTAYHTTQKLREGLARVIVGRDDTIELVLTALVAGGHVLIEDYPGSGKTTLAKTLGQLIARDESSRDDILPFRRIQFTPDLLPGDVLGVNVFEPKTGDFRFLHGPIVAHVVLADEINRTGPKVQAAFLEAMAEGQVTIDNHTRQLDQLFFVIATQNPIDMAGTYPLPQVQLDRFLLKVPMSYVDKASEMQILAHYSEIEENVRSVQPLCTRTEIVNARKALSSVHVSDELREAIVDISQATRNEATIELGASTRAALMLQGAVRAWALVHGRDYANDSDLKFMAPYVLLHRLRFHGGIGKPLEGLNEIMLPHIERLVARRM